MRIEFLSNYFNHHQKPLSVKLWALTGHQYYFVENADMDEERIALGWQESDRDLPVFVKKWDYDQIAFSNKESLIQSDIVITGSAPEKLVREHIRRGAVVFRYSERPLKEGNDVRKYLPRLIRWHLRNPTGKPIYLLCAGAYVSGDYARFHLFQNRAYKWGYFPETRKYDDLTGLMGRKNKKKILWAGRFIDWKHPEDALWVAKELYRRKIDFTMEMIGTGPLRQTLCGMVQEAKLEQQVTIADAIPPSEVRRKMEEAGIYLFTSDRREGWGAVLNEAMNSCCAVVASHEIGAVPFLIENERNGMVYRSGDRRGLLKRVISLLGNTDIQEQLGEAAYQSIVNEWNAEVAAQRLVCLSEQILRGNKHPDLYKTGPCSRAESIREDWYQG